MEWIEIGCLSIVVAFIVGLLWARVTYPKRLLQLRKQADIAAADYRVAVTAYWKSKPPSLDSTPFTFMIRRIVEAVPKVTAHLQWYHPFIVWRWKHMKSPDPDLWARVIHYAETRKLIH